MNVQRKRTIYHSLQEKRLNDCILHRLFPFLSKNWIHLLQNEGLRAHNYSSTLILGQLDSLKKSQIKDNHLKKYISKMSKPSLDFLKSICQQLFWYFLHESSLRFFLLQTIFATQNLDRSTHLPRWIYCPLPQAKKWLFNSNSAADNDLSWSLLKYLLSLHNVNTSIGCTPKETVPVPCRITMYCMST